MLNAFLLQLLSEKIEIDNQVGLQHRAFIDFMMKQARRRREGLRGFKISDLVFESVLGREYCRVKTNQTTKGHQSVGACHETVTGKRRKNTKRIMRPVSFNGKKIKINSTEEITLNHTVACQNQSFGNRNFIDILLFVCSLMWNFRKKIRSSKGRKVGVQDRRYKGLLQGIGSQHAQMLRGKRDPIP